jgi:hypothetical protein
MGDESPLADVTPDHAAALEPFQRAAQCPPSDADEVYQLPLGGKAIAGPVTPLGDECPEPVRRLVGLRLVDAIEHGAISSDLTGITSDAIR